MGLDIAHSVTSSWGNLKQEVPKSVKRHVSLSEDIVTGSRVAPKSEAREDEAVASRDISASGSEQGPLGPRDLTNLFGPGPQLPALLARPRGTTSPSRPQGRTPREGGVSQQGVTPFCHSTVVTMSYFTQQKLLFTPNHCKGSTYNLARVPTGRKKHPQLQSIRDQPPVCCSDQTPWPLRKHPLLLNLTPFCTTHGSRPASSQICQSGPCPSPTPK